MSERTNDKWSVSHSQEIRQTLFPSLFTVTLHYLAALQRVLQWDHPLTTSLCSCISQQPPENTDEFNNSSITCHLYQFKYHMFRSSDYFLSLLIISAEWCMFTILCCMQVGREHVTAEQMVAWSLLNKQDYCSTVKAAILFFFLFLKLTGCQIWRVIAKGVHVCVHQIWNKISRITFWKTAERDSFMAYMHRTSPETSEHLS